MAPRKKKIQAAGNDHVDNLEILRESYRVLNEFHQTVTQKARIKSPERPASAACINTFEQLLNHFKIIIDHQAGNQRDNDRLVRESSGVCNFFRSQVTCLYSLPLKNIFLPLKPALPDCPRTGFKDDAREIGQSWESILAAFGDGIRLYVNNAQHGPKLSQFQVLVGKVFYPFLAQVMGCSDSNNPQRLSEHVKRILLEAGEALSGGCAVNKELIQNPTIFGPAILSHNICNHSDFITANLALQLAFSVAPPIRICKGEPKSAKTSAETRTAREDWFKQIFPVNEFGKSLSEEMVSRLVSTSSKQFWAGLGDIQQKIFQKDQSRACAIPILAGTVAGNQIRLNAFVAPILKDTVQFNKSSVTWSCLVSKQGGDLISEDEELTAEICYDAISMARLTEFRSDFPIQTCAPAIYYAPDKDTFPATLELKLQPRYADATLKKFACIGSWKPQQTDDNKDIKIVDAASDPGVQRSVIKREISKISISHEPVGSWEAENSFKISAYPDLHQRVKSVQREAGINSSRDGDSTSVSERTNDPGIRDRRGPSVATESIAKSSPTVFHTGARITSKRKGASRLSSPVYISPSDDEVTQGKGSKRIRIAESSNDSIHSPPVCQPKKSSETETQKNSSSATRPTRETKVKTPVVVIPLLKSVKAVKSPDVSRRKSPVCERRKGIINIRESKPTKENMKASVESGSEEIIDLSEPEDQTDHVQPESVDSIDDAYDKIVETRQSIPPSRNESEVDDEIEQDFPVEQFPQSSKQGLETKTNDNSTGEKKKGFGRLSVVDMANGFRLPARKDKPRRHEKFGTSSPKDSEEENPKESEEEKTRPHAERSRKSIPRLEQKRISPAKSRAKRDTSSPDVDIIDTTTVNRGILKKAEYRKKSADRKLQHESRLFDLVQNLNARPKKVFGKEGSNETLVQDSKSASFAKRTTPSTSGGAQKKVQVPSSVSKVDPAAQETSIRSERHPKHVDSSKTGGLKPFRGIADMAEGSSTPLSRMQVGSSERSKKFTGKLEDPLKQKRLRFESPRDLNIERKTDSSTRLEKMKVFQKDTTPPIEDGHLGEIENLQSIKRKKVKLGVLKDEKDLLKSALKPSTPSESTPRLKLKEFQRNLEKKRKIGSSPGLELEKGFPDRLNPSVGKISDRLNETKATLPSRPSGSEGEKVTNQEVDLSSDMNQLTQILIEGVKKKQVKVEDVVTNTRWGVLNLTNNFLREHDSKCEELSEEITRCGLQRQDQFKQHLDIIKQDRINIEDDLDQFEHYMDARQKENHVESG